mmetsp:Transcript_21987/g.54411  ORF Transcript_21987/g.54411 Transcript_21987/m.54411 type:complete len:241 (-) Transcript_21987:889-1611(-)
MLDFLSFLLQDQIGSAVQLFRWDSMHTDRQDARIINFVWLLHLLDRFCFQKCRYVFQFSDTLGTFACQSANGARLISVFSSFFGYSQSFLNMHITIHMTAVRTRKMIPHGHSFLANVTNHILFGFHNPGNGYRFGSRSLFHFLQQIVVELVLQTDVGNARCILFGFVSFRSTTCFGQGFGGSRNPVFSVFLRNQSTTTSRRSGLSRVPLPFGSKGTALFSPLNNFIVSIWLANGTELSRL